MPQVRERMVHSMQASLAADGDPHGLTLQLRTQVR